MSRGFQILIAAVLGLAFGAGFPVLWGKNFNGGSRFIDGVGYLHSVSLAQGASSLEEIDTIFLSTQGADDHLRVFFNNYIAFTDEDHCPRLSKKPVNSECDGLWDRALANPRVLPNGHEISIYLRRGMNHLTVELENDKQGYCVAILDFKVGGHEPNGYIRAIPVSIATVNSLNGPWSSLSNSICSRRIYQFFLE